MSKRHVLCIKWGDRYGPEYVNHLFFGVKRHLSLPHQFHCLTEDAKGLHPDIHVLDIPKEEAHLWGWWQKLALFKKDFYGLTGDLLFIDLDNLILSDLDDFFTYKPDAFLMTKITEREGVNSSTVMRIQLGSRPEIWDRFWEDHAHHIQDYRIKGLGDQNWIYEHAPDHGVWPTEWVQYFKLNGSYHLTPFDFKMPWLMQAISHRFKIYAPEPTKGGKVFAFQGKPDLHEIIDHPHGKYRAAPWVRRFWHEGA